MDKTVTENVRENTQTTEFRSAAHRQAVCPNPIAESEMKASFFCTNSYLSPEPILHQGWPTPPRFSKPDIAVRSAEFALEQAQRADEAGFDWIACSEHHYMPALQTANPNIFAAAITRVVKRARIAVLGPLVSMTNPVRTAEELAILDQLSGGRLVALFLRGTPNEFLA